jgi:hypothetical protein
MAKPDYDFQGSVVIGCEGPADGLLRSGPAGPRTSRDGAKLKNVLADAHYWAGEFDPGESETKQVNLLENSDRTAVLAAITEAGKFLHHHEGRPGWRGGQINFAFAGHGTEGGDLVLTDGELSPDEILETIRESTPAPTAYRWLRLAVVLDSCFSGRTLARTLLHPLHSSHFLLIDGFAAALHDEFAWELDSLGHGALTFTMRNPGNAHVDRNRLARAVEERDEEYLRFALQAYVPNPVTYLTEGDQHSIDLMNGHHLEIKGCGSISLLDGFVLDQLLEKMEEVRANPNLDQIVES